MASSENENISWTLKNSGRMDGFCMGLPEKVAAL